VGSGAANLQKELVAKVKAVAPRTRAALLKSCPVANPSPLAPRAVREIDLSSHPTDIVVIGSSTGGPPVLEGILSALPASLACPLVVAQHMPAMFTKSMTQRLSEVCAIRLVHAEQDCLLEAGRAYICEGGRHARVHRIAATGRLRLEISAKPESALYKPSVTELFQSCALAAKERGVGVMLTGMGDDGKPGAIAMYKAGAKVLAQLGETCAVYGMPKAVVDSGAASAVLDPASLARALCGLGAGGGSRQAA
jgi:two-component system chemotaxis response regulator CheB